MKVRKFVDTVTIQVRSGRGGDGSASFRREKNVPRGGPDGGDGGRGGNIALRADRDETSLERLFFSPHQSTEDGGCGRGQQKHGRDAADLVITVPCGTEVRDHATGRFAGEVVRHGEEILVARGGRGGLGNCHFKSSTHRAPTEHTDGGPGEEAEIDLELKLVADIGLVGFPNAGKSSLLAALTGAHPKIAAYPFTTLNPVIGTLAFDPYRRVTLADIPGLIKGAHQGIGLGHEFLRHIERAPFLLLIVDMAGVDVRRPEEDYATLRDELRRHRPDLLDRPSFTVANKMDMPEAAENLAVFCAKTGTSPFSVSALTGAGIAELREAIIRFCRGSEPAG